jgi:hypothetical protein
MEVAAVIRSALNSSRADGPAVLQVLAQNNQLIITPRATLLLKYTIVPCYMPSFPAITRHIMHPPLHSKHR